MPLIVHALWSGKSMQLLCILPFGMLCLSTINMMFVKIMLAVCMLVVVVVVDPHLHACLEVSFHT